MKIVVCIKQVPDTTNVRMDRKTNTLIREGVESIINPFDEYALEEGVRLKEQYGGETTVLSMGPPQVQDALKDAISRGIDKAVHMLFCASCLLSKSMYAHPHVQDSPDGSIRIWLELPSTIVKLSQYPEPVAPRTQSISRNSENCPVLVADPRELQPLPVLILSVMVLPDLANLYEPDVAEFAWLLVEPLIV